MIISFWDFLSLRIAWYVRNWYLHNESVVLLNTCLIHFCPKFHITAFWCSFGMRAVILLPYIFIGWGRNICFVSRLYWLLICLLLVFKDHMRFKSNNVFIVYHIPKHTGIDRCTEKAILFWRFFSVLQIKICWIWRHKDTGLDVEWKWNWALIIPLTNWIPAIIFGELLRIQNNKIVF